ncbi:DegT/DnrJ/EryC1/StrS family aminotransferase [Halegenticoccus tardaugens]|uniref:DegT/DnrJ/EryC1/StrS family aminotransferase n=1 Tax=Halegenticoccus tardaugens TaxID=2071624 RepID=UPI00100C2D23|nr:DegT/DnrJ/EryC1/StrS family aminotransferase [Halegenticoccus tardaugens]
MYVHHSPHFNPAWLGSRDVGIPEWLADGRWIPSGDFGLYTHARTGLAAALSRHGVDGGTALVPAYTPPSVVGVLDREFDLQVEYFPVREDLTVPTGDVVDLIRDREPDVVQLIHYLGFETNGLDELAAEAEAVDAVFVEDCARGLFSRREDGTPLGSVGDVAMFSLRKTLPVPNGGLVVAPGTRLPSPDDEAREGRALARSFAVAAHERLSSAIPSIPRLRFVEESMRRSTALRRLTDGPLLSAGAGVFAGDGAPGTAHDHRVPPRRPGWVSRIGLVRSRPAEIAAARRERYRNLRARLDALSGLAVVTPPVADGGCPYGVGVRPVDGVSAPALWAALRDRGLPAEMLGWALGADVPQPADPGATALRQSLVVLPTHQQLPFPALPRMVEAVQETLRGRG